MARHLSLGKYLGAPFVAIRNLFCWVGFHDTEYSGEMGAYEPRVPCQWCGFDPWKTTDG